MEGVLSKLTRPRQVLNRTQSARSSLVSCDTSQRLACSNFQIGGWDLIVSHFPCAHSYPDQFQSQVSKPLLSLLRVEAGGKLAAWDVDFQGALTIVAW